MALKWRAYYSDGRTFDSSGSTWVSLPPTNLVGVVVFKEHPYRVVLDGYDWIYLLDDEFHIVDTHPEWGKWAERPKVYCLSCVKQGAAMPDDEWEALQKRMFEDRSWP